MASLDKLTKLLSQDNNQAVAGAVDFSSAAEERREHKQTREEELKAAAQALAKIANLLDSLRVLILSGARGSRRCQEGDAVRTGTDTGMHASVHSLRQTNTRKTGEKKRRSVISERKQIMVKWTAKDFDVLVSAVKESQKTGSNRSQILFK